MNKILLTLLVLVLVAAVGSYQWLNRPQTPPRAPIDPAALQAAQLPRAGTGRHQSAEFSTVQHREDSETLFAESLRYLAPGATAPVLRRSPAIAAGETPAGADSPERKISEVRADERTWTGVILVPTSNVLGFGHTALVALQRIEVHPRLDRRMRVWARLGNTTHEPLQLSVACSFRGEAETDAASPPFERIVIPAGGSRDVVFLSPKPDGNRYTVLVRL